MKKIFDRQVKKLGIPFTMFSALALLIMAPLLRPGFVFALDMVPTPVWRLPSHVAASYTFYALMHVLNFVIPGDVLQKLLLLIIFILAGLGMYRLAEKIQKPEPHAFTTHQIGIYFSGIFYVINPYVYSRFMAGQFAVLFGYALLPWFARSLLLFLKQPGWRSALKIGILATIIGIVSIHSLGLLFLLSGTGLVLTIWRARDNLPALRRLAIFVAASGGTFVLLSSYWLVPLFAGRGVTAGAIGGFNAGDQQAFVTTGGSILGRLANISRLEGFWVEKQALYRMPQEIGLVWWFALLAVLSLVVLGVLRLWQSGKRYETALFGFSALVAAFLAAGIFAPWFTAHVPLFAGYREPHKFVGLVGLAYALFAGYGVSAALSWCMERRMQYVIVLLATVLFLPFVFTPSLLLGGGKQLAAQQYPDSWHRVNSQLNEDKQHFKVLFLPWHLYMHFSFAGTIIANPAENFFDKPVLINNDPEFEHSSPSKHDPAKNFIGQTILPAASQHNRIGMQLSRLRIKYVILATESDSDTYSYIDQQEDLQLVFRDEKISLYRNKIFGQEH
jgi:hypothetical protein